MLVVRSIKQASRRPKRSLYIKQPSFPWNVLRKPSGMAINQTQTKCSIGAPLSSLDPTDKPETDALMIHILETTSTLINCPGLGIIVIPLLVPFLGFSLLIPFWSHFSLLCPVMTLSVLPRCFRFWPPPPQLHSCIPIIFPYSCYTG